AGRAGVHEIVRADVLPRTGLGELTELEAAVVVHRGLVHEDDLAATAGRGGALVGHAGGRVSRAKPRVRRGRAHPRVARVRRTRHAVRAVGSVGAATGGDHGAVAHPVRA